MVSSASSGGGGGGSGGSGGGNNGGHSGIPTMIGSPGSSSLDTVGSPDGKLIGKFRLKNWELFYDY